MFPSKLILPVLFHFLLITAVVITGLVMTSNPLFILGLFFMPDYPMLVPETPPAEEPEKANGIGFLADLSDPDDGDEEENARSQ